MTPPMLEQNPEASPAGAPHPLRRWLESLDIAAFTCDPAGLLTWKNRAACDLLGREPGIGDPADRHLALTPAFSREGEPIDPERIWQAPAADTTSEPEEIWIERPDGRRRPVLAHATPLIEEGRPAGALLMLVDASAQTRGEEAESRLSAIVDSSNDAILSRGLDGRVLSWNAGAARMFGFSADEAMGRTIDLLVPPEARAEEGRRLARIARGEHVEPCEARRVTRRGDVLRVSVASSAIRDAGGQVIGASQIERDVTEQTRMVDSLVAVKDELATQLADLRRLHAMSVRLWTTTEMRPIAEDVLRTAAAVEGTEMGILSLADAEGDLLRVEAALGLDSAFLDHVAAVPAGRGACGACWRDRRRVVVEDVESDTVAETEIEALRRAGIRAVHCTPLVTRSGKAVGVISLYFRAPHHPPDRAMHFADLCARQAADAIENARLYADLREADRAKDEFLAVLAHELRNPLSPIRNSAELLRLLPVNSDESRTALEVINRQVAHMTRLIEDLLDVARITGGKLELRRSRILLSEVVDAATETSRALLEENGQPLDITLPPRPVYLDADLTRLAQVVANLLNNASKFSPRGSRISLSASREGAEVVLSVRDSGVGIPESGLTRIFEIFCQAPTGERTHGGLGIGLTLVKRLTELHGGTVRASSGGPGRGSEFVVRLPVALADGNGSAPAHGTSSVVAAPARRILIVDDNRDAADSLALILRLKGGDVRVEYEGHAALATAAEFGPAVVLLDIGLPGMSGYEVAHELRRQPGGENFLLVATTGWSQPSDRERSRAAGFDHHLVKPIEPAALLTLLGEPAPRA